MARRVRTNNFKLLHAGVPGVELWQRWQRQGLVIIEVEVGSKAAHETLAQLSEDNGYCLARSQDVGGPDKVGVLPHEEADARLKIGAAGLVVRD